MALNRITTMFIHFKKLNVAADFANIQKAVCFTEPAILIF